MEILLEGNERKVALYLLKSPYRSNYEISKNLKLHKFTERNIIRKFEKYGLIENREFRKEKLKIKRDSEYLIENIQYLILGMIIAIVTSIFYGNSILLGALIVFIPQTFFVLKNYFLNEDLWKVFVVQE